MRIGVQIAIAIGLQACTGARSATVLSWAHATEVDSAMRASDGKVGRYTLSFVVDLIREREALEVLEGFADIDCTTPERLPVSRLSFARYRRGHSYRDIKVLSVREATAECKRHTDGVQLSLSISTDDRDYSGLVLEGVASPGRVFEMPVDERPENYPWPGFK